MVNARAAWLLWPLLASQPTTVAQVVGGNASNGQMWAGQDTIPTVEIRAERLTARHNGLKTSELDSVALLSSINLTEAFADGRLGIWAAQNGPGGLATLSARGAGGSRTAVVWNGLPLQSAMNGVTDGSLLSFFENDKISVQTGGASSLAGSGSIGGTVSLTAGFPQKTGWSGHAGSDVGSFGSWREEGGVFFKNTRGNGGGLRGQFSTALNDFPFKNTSRIGAPTVRQVNARQQKADLQQFNQFVFNEKTVATTAVWLTVSDRQIPPTMTEALHDDRQLDTSLRATASILRQIDRRLSLRARGGWMYESIFFHWSGGDEFSRAKTLLGEVEGVFSTARSTLRLGLFTDRQTASSDSYDGRFRRVDRAMFLFQTVDFQKVTVSLTGRAAFSDRRRVVPTGSVGFEKKGGDSGFRPRLHLSRNYALPTFNDRFWATGGNPDLQPEGSWSAEAGSSFSKKFGEKTAWRADLTAFSMWVDDWIQWSPEAGNPSFWRPHNFKKVRSAGLEFSAGFDQRLPRGWRLSLDGNGRLNQLRSLKFYENSQPDGPIRQPVALVGGRAVVSKGRLQAVFSQNFTGFSEGLRAAGFKDYSVGSLAFFFTRPSRAGTARAFLKIDNLWGRDFQVLPFRAMPGRSFRAGGRVSF